MCRLPLPQRGCDDTALLPQTTNDSKTHAWTSIDIPRYMLGSKRYPYGQYYHMLHLLPLGNKLHFMIGSTISALETEEPCHHLHEYCLANAFKSRMVLGDMLPLRIKQSKEARRMST